MTRVTPETPSSNEQKVDLRMPFDLVWKIGFIASVNETSIGAEIRQAVEDRITVLTQDPEFEAKAAPYWEEHQAVIKALESLDELPVDTEQA